MKRNMTRVFSALLLLQAAVVFGDFARQDLPTESGTELLRDTVYTVTTDTTITGKPQNSALRVAVGGTVILNVPTGRTLALTGGAGSGMQPGGAGIEVPAESRLIITGGGRVRVTGGQAGNGVKGSSGTSAGRRTSTPDHPCEIDNDPNESGCFYNGLGGSGGNGGGGAGAGIGGKGGVGGWGGAGGSVEHLRYSHTSANPTFGVSGANGSKGGDGNGGVGMGEVYILGRVCVEATGGARAADAPQGDGRGSLYLDIAGDDWVASGGSPGGGGGSGNGGAGIGGGGGGGAGGGGGGAGMLVRFDNINNINHGLDNTSSGLHATPEQFVAGYGCSANLNFIGQGASKEDRYAGTVKAGNGGYKGNAGSSGAAGTLFVAPSAGVTASPFRFGKPFVALKQGLFPVNYRFVDRSTTTVVAASFGATLPQPPKNPKRAGYRFLGWWTTSSGTDGECRYAVSASGETCVPMAAACQEVEDVTLYARWDYSPSILTVTTNEDDEERSDDKVTLRMAVAALENDRTLTGTNGYRRIVFDLPADKLTIKLKKRLELSERDGRLAPEFEIWGLTAHGPVTLAAENPTRYESLLLVMTRRVTISYVRFLCPTRTDTAGSSGGAISQTGYSTLNLYDCVFEGGSTAMRGCAISASAFAFSPASSVFLRAVNCTFVGQKGGSVECTKALAWFLNCSFIGNDASNLSDPSGSAVYVGTGDSNASVLFAGCTFAGNSSSPSAPSVCAKNCELVAVNTIFGDGEGSFVLNDNERSKMIACSVGDADRFLENFGTPLTNDVGAAHVYYRPKCDAASGNLDAAEILTENRLLYCVAQYQGKKTPLFSGSEEHAKFPLVIDQLRSLRMAPNRGAIRAFVGTQPPVVNVEGVYRGEGVDNGKLTSSVRVGYDDGTTQEKSVTFAVDPASKAFAVPIEVEPSDGTTHNPVSVKIDRLDAEPLAVTTAPFAFVADSALALASDTADIVLPGDGFAAGTVNANGVVAERALKVEGSEFYAGNVRHFGSICLNGVSVAEGRFDFLGHDGSMTFNAAEADFGGNGETVVCGGQDTVTKEWKVATDGFIQVRAVAQGCGDENYRLSFHVGSLELTPLAPVGAMPSGTRTLIWTCPIARDEKAVLTIRNTGVRSENNKFSVNVKQNFVPFGRTDLEGGKL